MRLGTDTAHRDIDRYPRRRQTVNIHGFKDTLSDGSLYPGRALLVVTVLTLVAVALRAF